MTLNEADTHANFIDPRLEVARWDRDQIKHYYYRDVAYTPGRVFSRGTRFRCKEGRKANYLIRYANFPITAVEAKTEKGFDQSKGYARDFGRAIYLCNERPRYPENDCFTRQSDKLEAFASQGHDLTREQGFSFLNN